MTKRSTAAITACLALAAGLCPASVLAAGPTTISLPVPPVVLGPPPAPLASPHTAPYAGLVNQAHSRVPFRWGWFGAERQSPLTHRHRGYYDSPVYWSQHPR